MIWEMNFQWKAKNVKNKSETTPHSVICVAHNTDHGSIKIVTLYVSFTCRKYLYSLWHSIGNNELDTHPKQERVPFLN